MTEHKFKIGEAVYFQPKKSNALRARYHVVRRLPATEGEFQYVIRNAYEDQQRVAMESELSSN